MTTEQKCWCGGRVALSACLDSIYHDPFSDGRRTRHTRLYVAGPMTGYPESNYPAFHDASKRLRDAGYEVVSPAEFGAESGHYTDLIREDLRLMLDVHGVATLEYWWESQGARNEVAVGGILKMPIRTVNDWLQRSPQELDA